MSNIHDSKTKSSNETDFPVDMPEAISLTGSMEMTSTINIRVYRFSEFEPKRRELLELARRVIPELNVPDNIKWIDLVTTINELRPSWQLDAVQYVSEFEAILNRHLPGRNRYAVHSKEKLPVSLAQPTPYEFRRLGEAISDGPSGNNWTIPGDQEIARLVHTRGDNDHARIILRHNERLLLWGADNTPDALKAELQALDADAVFCLMIIVALTLQHERKTYTLDDIILLVGRGEAARVSQAERQEIRRAVWRVVLLGASCEIRGYKPGLWVINPTTGEKGKRLVSDMIYHLGQIVPFPQLSFDPSEPPESFELIQSTYVSENIGTSKYFDSIGDLLTLARCTPAKQPAGHVARVMGLNLNQYWRERGTRSEIEITKDGITTITSEPLTRRQLIAGYYKTTKPSILGILDSSNPKRAIEYMENGFRLLCNAGIVKEVKPLKGLKLLSERSPGWKDEWLDQPLQITPGQQATVEQITGMIGRQKKRESSRRTAKKNGATAGKRGRPRKARQAA